MWYSNLNDALANKDKVETLYLSYKKLTTLPEELQELHNLENLHITSNKLSELPDWLENLPKLKHIFASYNQIKKVGKIQQIESLDLSHNQLKELPEGIENLTALSSIILNENSFSKVLDFSGLSALIKLDINNSKLKQFPINLAASLKYLTLRNNELVTLNDEIKELEILQKLDLHGNQLTTLSDAFQKLKELVRIILTNNKLTELPNSIGQLVNLIELHLSDNFLKILPDSIGNLSNLSQLTVDANELTQLPSSLQNLEKLNFCNFSHNEIQDFPTVLKNTDISSLYFSGNHLTEIPDEISEFEQLEYVYLGNNKISKISTKISECKQLDYLALNNNQLSELPKEIAELPNLSYLLLGNNQLTELPTKIYEHLKISSLYIQNNPFSKPPIDALFIPNLKYGNFTQTGIDIIITSKYKQFASACKRKNTTPEFREIFYHIIADKQLNSHNFPLEYFFKALNISFAPLQENALNYLRHNWKEKLATNPIQENVHITVLGKSSFKKTSLKQQLKELNIGYSPKITKKTTHVILEKDVKSTEGCEQEHLIFIPEIALQAYLDERESRYFAQEDIPTEEVDNLQALLTSVDSDMVSVGLEMIHSLGFPKELVTEVFLIFKNTKMNNNIRSKAKKLLYLHGSKELKSNLEKNNLYNIISNNWTNNSTLRSYVYSFTKGTELDMQKILNYLCIQYKKSCAAFISLLETDNERIHFLKHYVQSTSSNLMIIDSFFKDKNMIYNLPKEIVKSVKITQRCEEFPTQLLELTYLEELTLNRVGLPELPEELIQLTKLNKLDIANNRMKKFPRIIEKMTNLKTVYLSNNAFGKLKKEKPSENIFDLTYYPREISRL